VNKKKGGAFVLLIKPKMCNKWPLDSPTRVTLKGKRMFSFELSQN